MSPIFEFQCEHGHIFELVLQSGSKGWHQPMPCPACGSLGSRIMSTPAPPQGGGTPKHHSSGGSSGSA